MTLMKRAIRQLKDELQIWHILVAFILVGVTAVTVTGSGSARYITTCHRQAEEWTKEQVIQQMEALPLHAATAQSTIADSDNESLYTRAYRRCLREMGIQQ